MSDVTWNSDLGEHKVLGWIIYDANGSNVKVIILARIGRKLIARHRQRRGK